jgi:hypothetical protein
MADPVAGLTALYTCMMAPLRWEKPAKVNK